MKRSLLICAAALMTLLSVPEVKADTIHLTLDLNNAIRTNPTSGGTWALWARKVETGSAPEGNFGISSIRALINNINEAGVTFSGSIGQQAGGPYVNTLSNGVVEILYGQNLNGTVVNNVGVFANANQEVLIASGTWPAGPRPTFGVDPSPNTTPPGPFPSEGNFLGGNSAPYPASVAATITTSVIHTGDLNNSNTVTSADTAQFVARLPGASPSLPYTFAADMNHSGTVTSADIALYVARLSAPLVAEVGAIPEPSTMGLMLLSSIGLLGRRRRV